MKTMGRWSLLQVHVIQIVQAQAAVNKNLTVEVKVMTKEAIRKRRRARSMGNTRRTSLINRTQMMIQTERRVVAIWGSGPTLTISMTSRSRTKMKWK